MESQKYDVVVIGCGMAGLSAGLRAAELDHSVMVLEKSEKEDRGGQTGYSESFRVASTEADLSEWGYEFNVPEYTPEDFYDDIMARTNDKADPELARTVVDNSGPTVEWLTRHGIDWDMDPLAPGYTAARTWFDNDALLDTLVGAIEAEGGNVIYEAEARELDIGDDYRVQAVEAVVGDSRIRFDCVAAIVASGGYESSEEKRAAYMGHGYEDMKVRGSPFNTGEAIEATIAAGAEAVGQWSGAHMALIDANAPSFGGGANRVDGYQYGLMFNVEGNRFVDEGEDARAHTYAKFGREIFEQPNHLVFIVVDDSKHDLVRATGPSNPVEADSLEALFDELDFESNHARERALAIVREYNEKCDPDKFDPNELNGNDADLKPPKSNWATPLDQPPYYAYAVTGGITFAFGGVSIDSRARVLDSRGRPINGLYAAGNSTGGLFYDNYPGGTGLMNAAVFGKIAAEEAGKKM